MKLFEEILLTQACGTKDQEVRDIVERELSQIDDVIFYEDHIGNIIARRGEGPYPTFCCHLDTVHKITKNYVVEKHEVKQYTSKRRGKKKSRKKTYDGVQDYLYTSAQGIGGDDKCGIYGCLELMRSLRNVKAMFFVQEECGTIGARGIELSEFEDSAYLIELDRRGNSDIIMDYNFSETISPKFEEVLEQQMGDDWEQADGTFTDVMILAERGVGISAINVSCGYYKAHTKEEYISWKDLNKSIAFCFDLAQALGQDVYSHEYEDQAFGFGAQGWRVPPARGDWFRTSYSRPNAWNRTWNEDFSRQEDEFDDGEIIDAIEGEPVPYCPECGDLLSRVEVDEIYVCYSCGEAFFRDDGILIRYADA